MKTTTRPRIAVWKFASCDGCQLQLLDLGDDLLSLLDAVEIGCFLEASRRVLPGPYDLSLVEGSISTPEDEARIRKIRAESRILVAIGACATAGGIQALRNGVALGGVIAAVYPDPATIESLAESRPASDYVEVDHELHGCPIDRGQLVELISALLSGRRPHLPDSAVCLDCKAAGHACLIVERGEPCMGPVTRSGCSALCPGHGRPCYGCFGPAEAANLPAFEALLEAQGISQERRERLLATFNVTAFAAQRREA